MSYTEKIQAAKKLMELLEIPVHSRMVSQVAPPVVAYEVAMTTLYDIFTDEEKLKTLIFKLKNKSFA